MNLFLHIGLHKTGTTFIQKNLKKNSIVLREKGVQFNPAELYDFVCGRVKEGEFNLNGAFSQAISSVVVSREQLSWRASFDEIKYLSVLEKYFSKVNVVLYLRRQDKLAISHKHQGLKNTVHNSYKENEIYGLDEGALPTINYIQYLDYYRRYNLWGKLFGFQNIIIKDFDLEVRRENLLESFYRMFLNDLDGIEFFSDGRNESLGGAQCEVLKFYRKKLLLKEISVSHYKKICKLVKESVDDSTKLIPSRKQAEEFYSAYHESNEKLRHSSGFNFLDQSFLNYPEREVAPSRSDVMNILDRIYKDGNIC